MFKIRVVILGTVSMEAHQCYLHTKLYRTFFAKGYIQNYCEYQCDVDRWDQVIMILCVVYVLNELAAWSRALPEKLTVPQLVATNYSHIMEPDGSFFTAFTSVTCPYPDADHSNPCFPIPLLEDKF
jgi:hypothetical protein